jgi:pimeloyl-ACP methyl ester carboxylesterase
VNRVYGEIRAPTVILTGSADTTVSPHLHAHAMASAVPHARLVMLAGVGHMPHHVAADAVMAAVEQLPAPAAARGATASTVTSA